MTVLLLVPVRYSLSNLILSISTTFMDVNYKEEGPGTLMGKGCLGPIITVSKPFMYQHDKVNDTGNSPSF